MVAWFCKSRTLHCRILELHIGTFAFPTPLVRAFVKFYLLFLHVLHFYRLGSKPFLVFQSSSCQISILEFVLWHSYCAVHFLIFTEAFRIFYVKWNQVVVWIEAITMDWHSENPSALFVNIRSSISSYQLYLTIICCFKINQKI